MLGVAKESGNGYTAGEYLKSGNYFVSFANYIQGLEHGLKNTYEETNRNNKTEAVTLKRQTYNGVENVAKSQGENALVIGSRAGAFGNNAIALGRGAFSLENNTFAMGSYSYAKSKNAMAVGVASRALGENSVAFGNGAGADISAKNSMVFGPGSVAFSPNSLILGINSRTWESASDSIVVGNEASTEGNRALTGHSGARTLAIGNKTKATLDNSVALGYLSETDYTREELEKPGYTARGSYSIPSSVKVGIISVGKKGYERRIANLASGYRDSDAVTVSQLKTVEDKIKGISENEDNTTRYFSINKKNGSIQTLDDLGRREVNYRNYLNYLTQKITIQARKTDGEEINENEASLTEMYGKLTTLKNDANIKSKPTRVNALLAKVYDNPDSIFTVKGQNQGKFVKRSGVGADKYWDGATFKIGTFLEDLEAAKKEDETNNIFTDAEIAQLNDANFSNKGAYGIDSLAIGYKAQTGNVTHINTKHESPRVTGGRNAAAIGNEAKALGDNTLAVGNKAEAVNERSIAIGAFNTDGDLATKAVGITSIAIGSGAQASGNDGIAFGRKTKATTAGIAIGGVSEANGNYSVALGYDSKAHGESSVVIGRESNVQGKESIVIGKGSSTGSAARKADWAVVIGNSAKAEAAADGKITDVVVIGGNSQSSANHTVAMGNGAKTTAQYAVAIGKGVSAEGEKTVVIGHDAGTHNNSAHKPTSAVIIGDGARVGNTASVIDGGVAIGKSAKAFNVNGLALGTGAQVSKDNSVALGSKSVNTATLANSGYDPKTKTSSTLTTAIWRTTWGEVSVGNGSTNTRRITGVAAGDADTDAVNVAQLKKVTGEAVKYFSVNATTPRDGVTSLGTQNADNSGANGAEGSIAIGVGAVSNVDGSVAIGYGAKNNPSTAVRLQNEKSSIAIGLNAQTQNSDPIAIGQNATASAGNAFALGKSARGSQNGALATWYYCRCTNKKWGCIRGSIGC